MSLSSVINPLTSALHQTNVTSHTEPLGFCPDQTVVEGDALRRPVILPLPWRSHGQAQQLNTPSHPKTYMTDNSGPADVASSRGVRAVEDQRLASDTGDGRWVLSDGSPPVPLPVSSVSREQDFRAHRRGEQDLRILRTNTKHLLNTADASGLRIVFNSTAPPPTESTKVVSESNKRDGEGLEGPIPRQSIALTATIKRKRSPRPGRLNRKMPKTNLRPGRLYESQWRIGQAPTAGLKESKEQTSFDRVLTAISRYYQGNADGTWKVALRNNATEYDGKGLTEGLATSIIMASGLVAAGQASYATLTLNRTLPLAEILFLTQHPQLCYWLIELGMDTTQTVAGRVRRSIKAQFAPLACRLLGLDHPISLLLTTPLTTEQQVRMRKEGQMVVHDSHVRTFGTYSYQNMVHQWFWARTMAAVGHFDEAMRMLQDLTGAWELYSSRNSAVAVSALIEHARIMVASGDASVKVECMFSDALRRIDVINSSQSLENPTTDLAEVRLREGGLIFSQLAAFRALGRVHVMRWNLGAAILCFEQAVRIDEAGLGAKSSVRKLCETDLEATRMLELERAMGVLSVGDPMTRLPPISSIISLVPTES